MKAYAEELKRALDSIDEGAIDHAVDLILNSASVFICGNGGSASTASHMACDFQKWAHSLPSSALSVSASALSDNTAAMTAIANDKGYDYVFSEQLRALGGHPDDLLIVLSVSGTSPNIVKAVFEAKRQGINSIALLGTGPVQVPMMATCVIEVASRDYGIVEDCHAAVMHVMTRKIRTALSV